MDDLKRSGCSTTKLDPVGRCGGRELTAAKREDLNGYGNEARKSLQLGKFRALVSTDCEIIGGKDPRQPDTSRTRTKVDGAETGYLLHQDTMPGKQERWAEGVKSAERVTVAQRRLSTVDQSKS